jgi:hypothetical protein
MAWNITSSSRGTNKDNMEQQNGFHQIEQSPERDRLIYLSVSEQADMQKEIQVATLNITAVYTALAQYRKARYEQEN